MRGGGIIQIKDSAKLPIKNLRLFGKSEQAVSTGKNLADLSSIQRGMIVSELRGSVKSDIQNYYFTTVRITNPIVLDKIKNTNNVNIGFSVKRNVPDGMISIVIFGTRTNGAEWFEVSGDTGSNKVTHLFNNDFIAIDRIELRFNRKGTVFTDTTTVFEELKFWIGDEPAFEPFSNCKITPTPDNPSPITSIGEKGNINVSVNEQNLVIPTPNGLPGIKVTSGGNYTDTTGQQWICDEIDLARGKYIQRVDVFKDLTYRLHNGFKAGNSELFSCEEDINNDNSSVRYSTICTHLLENQSVLNKEEDGCYVAYKKLFIRLKGVIDLATFNSKMQNAIFYVVKDVPAEKDLSPLEIEAFKQLHANYPTTTISNDENCDMELEYTVDTKSYVDKKIAEISGAVIAQKGI